MLRIVTLFLMSALCFLPAYTQEEAAQVQDATQVQEAQQQIQDATQVLEEDALTEEPPLSEVFDKLGLVLTPEDEITMEGPTQGLFIKTEENIEYLLIAKYSFGVQPKTSVVRAGMYLFKPDPKLQLLFECGPEAGNKTRITGLPATPKGRARFDPGFTPIGFYVQSANFNPEFSPKGETVYSQDERNKEIERFGDDLHKAHIYPYKTKHGTVPNWYVICWEFSTNNDNQDIITLVRGVKLINIPQGKELPEKELQTEPKVVMR